MNVLITPCFYDFSTFTVEFNVYTDTSSNVCYEAMSSMKMPVILFICYAVPQMLLGGL